MTRRRALSLALVCVVGTVWAACVVMAGLWLVLDAPRQWPALDWPMRWGGVSLVLMGTFVFMYVVADRIFPLVGRRLAWRVELVIVMMAVASSLLTFWPLLWSEMGSAH